MSGRSAGRTLQAAAAVLMVRPDHFGSNPETLASNGFQTLGTSTPAMSAAVLAEFERLAEALARTGVDVHVFAGRRAPASPDEVFPNNWFSTHADGTLVLYPLMAPSRRLERRTDVIEALCGRYAIIRTVDLSASEREGVFLEGTGSLVLDRPGRAAYACLSPRTSTAAVRAYAAALGDSVHAFEATDAAGRPIYHTNVLLSLGTRFAVVCGAAVSDPATKRDLFTRLEGSGRQVLDIGFPEMAAFAANILELASPSGPILALSTRALAALHPQRRRALESHAALVPVDVGTIETYGGGSVRCMLAEIHLAKKRKKGSEPFFLSLSPAAASSRPSCAEARAARHGR